MMMSVMFLVHLFHLLMMFLSKLFHLFIVFFTYLAMFHAMVVMMHSMRRWRWWAVA